MERKHRGEALGALWTKYRMAALIMAAGIACLLWPAGSQETAEPAENAGAESETLLQTEARMERILGRIHGVGRLQLMLTLESTARQELAVDTEISVRGNASNPGDSSRRSETVIISGTDGEEPVVEYCVSPSYRGAVVVCEGAENASVRLAVTQAVSALTGLGSDRIVVIRCQS